MKKVNQFGKKITSISRHSLIYDVDFVFVSTSAPFTCNFIIKIHHTKFGPRRYIYVSNKDFTELCSYHSYISKGDYETIFLDGVLRYEDIYYSVDAVDVKSFYYQRGLLYGTKTYKEF